MAANNRIFYACQLVGVTNMAQNAEVVIVHGVQSVGITTNFNLEQAFELGQIQVYENIEGLPDVEITMEKVLDGYPLMYHLCSPAASSSNLVGRGKERADLYLGIYSDAFDSVNDGSQNEPPVEIYCSGVYVGNVSYTVPVDGNATESITLQGNDKEWRTTGVKLRSSQSGGGGGGPLGTKIGGADYPLALSGYSGGIQRRENVIMERCIFPGDMYGIVNNDWGTNDQTGDPLYSGNAFDWANKTPRVHIQNVNISTDFSREDILELGRKAPYFRSPGFPIEVTCEIEAIAISGDFVGAYEKGDPDLFPDGQASGDNTKERRIAIVLQDLTLFDMGTKNRLSSVSYGGGDAAGGNVSITYSYTNFNDLNVCHKGDPANSNHLLYSPTQSGLMTAVTAAHGGGILP